MAAAPASVMFQQPSVDDALQSAKCASLLKAYRVLINKAATTVETRERVKLQAWRELQSLPEDVAMCATDDTLGDLLTMWSYFAQQWENGREGPASPLDPTLSLKDSDEINIDVDEKMLRGRIEVMLSVEKRVFEQREGGESSSPSNGGGESATSSGSGGTGQPHQRVQQETHEVPRYDPLNEMIE